MKDISSSQRKLIEMVQMSKTHTTQREKNNFRKGEC